MATDESKNIKSEFEFNIEKLKKIKTKLSDEHESSVRLHPDNNPTEDWAWIGVRAQMSYLDGFNACDKLYAPLVMELRKNRYHGQCDDCYYSCPKSGECCNEDAGNECDCGADSVIQVLKQLGELDDK